MCLKHQNLILKKKKSQQFAFVKSTTTNFLTSKQTNSTNLANRPEMPAPRVGTHPSGCCAAYNSASTSALLTLRTVFGTYFDFFPYEKKQKDQLFESGDWESS